ncbi:MAG TPA: hypothetical protein EYO01_02880 [Phycisphaerales bacterium]|nr:hypothetical protein [Phycisphaerales bacterium]HIB01632.1 hypothetical protein [Phycisphaerales bacterium]HIN84174.1 hypothetical protein [Phycisphaerales bacterium]
MSPLTVIVISLFTNPWADSIVSFDEGIGGSAGYNLPETALGEPSRFTGENVWPGVVSPFNSAWLSDEIVSLGAGGSIVVSFNEPVQDDPANPWGIDLLIFSNTGCIDNSYPNGVVGGLYSDDGGLIEVSQNGKQWFTISTTFADGLWPTRGFIDSQPYDAVEGTIPTDFTMPVDPRLTLDDVLLVDNDALMVLYRNSGGGTPIDIAETGLSSISFVRISVDASSKLSPEIDGFADVNPQIAGDVNMDGVVDVSDLLELISAFGPLEIGTPLADFNGDYIVNVIDLLELIGNWS